MSHTISQLESTFPKQYCYKATHYRALKNLFIDYRSYQKTNKILDTDNIKQKWKLMKK